MPKTMNRPAKTVALAPVKRTIFRVFQEKGRAKDYDIRSLIPEQCVQAAKERLGAEAAEKLQASLTAMNVAGLDSLQIRHGDRRIRIMQEQIG